MVLEGSMAKAAQIVPDRDEDRHPFRMCCHAMADAEDHNRHGHGQRVLWPVDVEHVDRADAKSHAVENRWNAHWRRHQKLHNQRGQGERIGTATPASEEREMEPSSWVPVLGAGSAREVGGTIRLGAEPTELVPASARHVIASADPLNHGAALGTSACISNVRPSLQHVLRVPRTRRLVPCFATSDTRDALARVAGRPTCPGRQLPWSRPLLRLRNRHPSKGAQSTTTRSPCRMRVVKRGEGPRA
mmetsp:Transcript_24443/g.64288  ORF Transcript_24443/g.64288 Transcript_24443/m.64288 type:complete len:245 (-) Transcript_24443:11-745(-)